VRSKIITNERLLITLIGGEGPLGARGLKEREVGWASGTKTEKKSLLWVTPLDQRETQRERSGFTVRDPFCGREEIRQVRRLGEGLVVRDAAIASHLWSRSARQSRQALIEKARQNQDAYRSGAGVCDFNPGENLSGF